jgi:uncharacterized protein YegP (UPF0339 family)
MRSFLEGGIPFDDVVAFNDVIALGAWVAVVATPARARRCGGVDGWRWRARAVNGEIVSESGEAHEDKSCAMGAARRIRRADADIQVEE